MSRQPFTMLFVDDEPPVRDFFNSIWLPRIQNSFLVNATIAKDANEVDRLLSDGHRFDLIVCDYHMPGKNGLEVFKGMISIYPNIAFVLFTGFIKDQRVLWHESEMKPENLYLCIDKNWSLLKEMVLTILTDLYDRGQSQSY